MPQPLRRLTHFLPSSPSFYLLAWITWFIVLWLLSSTTPKLDNAPKIPHFDKVAHFGYFFGGAGTLAGYLLTQTKIKLQLSTITLLCIIIGACVGAIDEWHQSYTPGRTGLDPWDWLADCAGSAVGVITMIWLWKMKTCSAPRE